MENYFQVNKLKNLKLIKLMILQILLWSQDSKFHQVSDFNINRSIAERIQNMVNKPSSLNLQKII